MGALVYQKIALICARAKHNLVSSIIFFYEIVIVSPRARVSNRKWVDILRALLADSSDGIEFTVKEVEAILGGNAAKLLNL